MELNFSEPLPWLAQSYAKVVSMYRQDRLPHALLIEGPKGVGKHSLALLLSAFVLCEKRNDQDLPCGVCKHCALLKSESHGGFKEVKRVEKETVIKVDAIRLLSEFAGGTSYLGGYKVIVVNPAEDMNVNAANALLKTLEEPSPKTLIILIAHSGGRLLPTIRSRCQCLPISPPDPESVFDWLHKRVADESSVRRVMAMSPDSPLLALDLLEKQSLLKMDRVLADLSGVLKRSVSVSDVAQSWAKDEPVDYIRWLCQCAHQLGRYSVTRDESYLVHDDAKKMFVYLAQRCTFVQLSNLYSRCFDQYCALTGANNLNAALVCESVLAAWLDLMLKSAQRAQ